MGHMPWRFDPVRGGGMSEESPHVRLVCVDRSFPVDPHGLLPPITSDNAEFWEGLARGALMLQRCSDCGKRRYPIAPVCPHCGKSRWAWRPHDGSGRIFSWVRYHKSYLPEFEDLMPYVVVVVALDDGPRMTGRLLEPHGDPAIGDKVGAVIERWPRGRHVLAFAKG
jgi:uncharacterized OB-fold protein